MMRITVTTVSSTWLWTHRDFVILVLIRYARELRDKTMDMQLPDPLSWTSSFFLFVLLIIIPRQVYSITRFASRVSRRKRTKVFEKYRSIHILVKQLKEGNRDVITIVQNLLKKKRKIKRKSKKDKHYTQGVFEVDGHDFRSIFSRFSKIGTLDSLPISVFPSLPTKKSVSETRRQLKIKLLSSSGHHFLSLYSC